MKDVVEGTAAFSPTEPITIRPPTEWAHDPSAVSSAIRGFPINPEDRPWIPAGYFEQKYLRLNPHTTEWIILVRVPAKEMVPYHKHHGPITIWVLEGFVNFVDEDWSAGPGTLVYEPPGNTHVEVSDEGCLLLAFGTGPIEFLNADNTTSEMRDPIMWRREIEEFHASTGTPLPPAPGYFW